MDQTLPRRLPWVTIALATANLAVFAWELAAGASPLQPSPQWMLEHGGNYGPLTLDGQQWRLFTSMFLHYGVLHVAMNLIGLVDGGRHVERMYGHAGFAALYLVSGLAGSLATSLRANVVSAGASGAVFGVFGAFAAFLLLHRDRLDRELVTRQARGLAIFLAYNLWFGITQKGVDLTAHLGGLAAGFVAGLALELGTDEGTTTPRRALAVGVVGAALLFGASLAAPRPVNAFMALAPVEEQVLGRWRNVVEEVQAKKLAEDALADVIERELLPPWRVARATFERDGDGPLRADMLSYLQARQEGWEQMAAGLRAKDPEAIERGMTTFGTADAVIERIRSKRR